MEDFLQQLVQTSLAFFAILIFARLIGKQQISQLTYYEYINGITLGSIAGTIATDSRDMMWNHLLDLTIFTVLTILVGYFVLNSRPVRKLLDGEPTVVIHNGKILGRNMRKMRYNADELLMQLRLKEIFNIKDVEFAIMEPNGELSILPKSQNRPLTPGDLKLDTRYEGMATELIMDGKIIHQNLVQNNLDEQWLLNQLKSQNIAKVEDVMLASLDTQGELYVDLKKDDLVSVRDVSDDPKDS